MENINRIEIRGKIGCCRIQEVAETRVANFTVLTEHIKKSADGAATIEATWHNVTAWENDRINNLDQIQKGKTIHLTGRNRIQKYTSAEGFEKTYLEIIASSIRVTDSETTEEQSLIYETEDACKEIRDRYLNALRRYLKKKGGSLDIYFKIDNPPTLIEIKRIFIDKNEKGEEVCITTKKDNEDWLITEYLTIDDMTDLMNHLGKRD